MIRIPCPHSKRKSTKCISRTLSSIFHKKSGSAMKHNLCVSCFLLLLAASSCTPVNITPPISSTAASQVGMVDLTPIIFDDDGSPDGTTALLYLLSHPEVDLKAISISFGEAHPEIYIQHIGRILDTFQITDISLGYGQDSPLAGSAGFPESLRQVANNFWGLPIPNPEKVYPAQDSAELMVSILNESSEPVVVFISGPCTNLAQALRLDPGIRNKIAAVFIMGGAVYVPGNTHDFFPDSENLVAELNFYGDPTAASEVLEAGLNVYLVPLDATNQVTITQQDTNQWRTGGPISDLAADIYDMLLGGPEAEMAIWDLMTAAIMLEPDLCEFQSLSLQVMTDEGNTSGQSAILPKGVPNVDVCLEPNAYLIRYTLNEIFSGDQ